jgi:membrane protein implicated in regulation of membrane protease activity
MAAMFEILIKTIVGALEVYSAVGFLFAIAFVAYGVQRLDLQAKGTRVGFRLLILPGVAAFWPMFLRRWMQGLNAPQERNAHGEKGGA